MNIFESLRCKEIANKIEFSYPAPIALTFRKYRTMPPEDLHGIEKSAINLFEVFIKTICFIALQEARQNNLFVEQIRAIEKTLDVIKVPSLGSWLTILRMLCSKEFIYDGANWVPEIKKWFNQSKSNHWSALLKSMNTIERVNVQVRHKCPIDELCSSIVSYRNRYVAHGGKQTQQEVRKHLPLLDEALCALLESADFLANARMCKVNRVEKRAQDVWQVYASEFCGTGLEPMEIRTSVEFPLDEVCLLDRRTGTDDAIPVSLAPFVLVGNTRENELPEIFYYSSVMKTSIEYLCYHTGAYYNHKELRGIFEEFLDVKLAPGGVDVLALNLTREQRIEKSQDFLKKAILMKNQKRFEDAIANLETSLEYHRTGESFLELARVQLLLGTAPATVMMTVEKGLEAAPGNEQLERLDERLRRYEDEGGLLRAGEREDEVRTIIDAVCPVRWRAYSTWWVTMLLMAWYVPSCLLTWIYAPWTKLGAIVIVGLVSLLSLILLVSGRWWMNRMHDPLLQQVTTNLQQFEAWYKAGISLAFGRFVVRKNRKTLDWRATIALPAERIPAFALIAWMCILTPVTIYLCEDYTYPLLMFSLRVVDYGIFFFLLFFVTRYIVGTTLFVSRITQLAMRPMLSSVNDVGPRMLGSFFAFNLSLLCLIWPSILATAILGFVKTSFADFGLILFALCIVSIWSIILPFKIKFSMKSSKTDAVQRYDVHLRDSFNDFLEEPNDETLARYEWIRKNQSVLRAIPIWPMNVWQTIMVLGVSNVVLFSTVYAYAHIRLGYWPGVHEWAAMLSF